MDLTKTIKSFDYQTLLPKAQDWLFQHVLNTNTLYQFFVLLTAFFISLLLYSIFAKSIKSGIENSKLSAKGKRIGRSLAKLTFPLTTLVVIFVMTQIAASDFVGVDVWLIHGMMKALLAWIVIRSLVQFFDNAHIRNIFSITIWTIAALSIFGVLDKTTKTLDGISIDIGEFHLSLLAIFKGAFFLFILIYAAMAISSIIDMRVSRSKSLKRSSQVLISKIVRALLIAVALIIGITSAGIDLSLFAVFGGAIGLGIGLGLQKGVANLFSGMILLFDKSIEPGDFVELDNGTVGRIETMAGRYTEVLTLDNKSILIPNEEMISKPVINWSHGNKFIRVSVDFGVHYESDPNHVIEFAVKAASKPERVLDMPSGPVCYMTGLADSSVNFRLIFWINDPENGIGNVKGEVLLSLWYTFKENGIKIPYPHREVYVHKVDEPR